MAAMPAAVTPTPMPTAAPVERPESSEEELEEEEEPELESELEEEDEEPEETPSSSAEPVFVLEAASEGTVAPVSRVGKVSMRYGRRRVWVCVPGETSC